MTAKSSASIHSFDDYRPFLEAAMNEGRFGARGPRSKLAEAAGCQVAYVSQVFGGRADLSLEQASGVADYLKLDDEERGYFYDLVLHARAGTQDLRAFYAKRLRAARQNRLELGTRLRPAAEVQFEDRATYYSV